MIEDPRDPEETPEEGEPTADGVAPADADTGGSEAPTPEPDEADQHDEAPETAGESAESGTDEPPADPEPAAEEPAAEEPSAEEPAAEEPTAPQPAEPEPAVEGPAGDEPAEEAPAEDAPAPAARQAGGDDVIPGAHLEPDLVLEEEGAGSEAEQALAGAEFEAEEGALVQRDESEDEDDQPLAREPLDFAKDARYQATGKRKHAIARVILKPGDGTYRVNGRPLDDVFPRVKLQRMARQPLETAGYGSRMDVAARIHGGGVSAQAGALRHGIARALVEADPNLRTELKKRGFLTRDPRVKERKKAGLKKARKRPQFSKR
ncbi:MAG TPA: 30S ribosomal protein S9 [Thermoleophilaceae bacterium]|nr:30S ribosomal protein S9 [Thermoleophilaceae bacterium]